MKSGAGLQQWLLLILLGTIWGASFMLMKRAMVGSDGAELFDPFQVGALRMALAGLVMTPFLISIKWKQIKPKLWAILGVALFGNGIPAFLFPLSETRLNTGFVGMLNSTVPLFTMIIAVSVFKARVSLLNVLGLAIATTGTTLLIATNGEGMFDGNTSYAFLVLAATLCYAISINITRQYLQGVNAITIATIAFCGLMIPTGIYLGAISDMPKKLEAGGEMLNALGYTLILSVLGTAFSVIIFTRLIATSSAVFASSVTYLIPFVAALFGLSMGEVMGWEHVAGMALILTGVVLVNRKNVKSPQSLAD